MADEQATSKTAADEQSVEEKSTVAAKTSDTMQTAAVETPAVATEKPKFSKDQLIGSKSYRDRRDLLTVILEDGKQYTIDEVDQAIEEFMKKEVK